MRTTMLFFGLCFLSGAVSAVGAERHSARSRPNLIFVLTDDQRADTLGCYGNDFIETPNLDQLAADGVVFDRTYVTSAICTPSRACFFLGQFERRHGVNFNSATSMSLDAWANSFPVLLRDAGYFTGYVGKNHVPLGQNGYQTGAMEKSFDFWYAGHGHLTFYPKRRHAIFASATADTQVEVIQEGAASFLDQTEDFIAGAEAFLKRRPTGEPFCLSICFNVPHGAGTGSMEMAPTDDELYRTAYRDRIQDIPLPENYVPKADIREPKLPADVLYAEFRQREYDYVDRPDELRERMVRQFQTVTGVDRLIGNLRAQLASLGVEDNTVIIFTSDHGLMLGEFGLGGKALNYEPCLRVPMIVYDPRQATASRGTRVSELVQSIDVAPTLLDLAGVDAPATMQGHSVTPLVAGEETPWREFAFAENLWSTVFGNPRIESVCSERWKYLRYFENDREPWEGIVEGPAAYRLLPDQAQRYAEWLVASIKGERPVYEELFDLSNDPGETTNLAGDAEHAATLMRMREACQRLVREAKGDVNAPPATVPLPQDAKPE